MRRNDEEKIVRRCRRGDRQAYEVLVERYARLVFGLCLSAVGRPMDAEDLTQEVFMKGFLKISELKEGTLFAPWLLRIARNLCTDHLRKRQREQAFQSRPRQDEATRPESLASSTLNNAISRLPEKYRQPLILYYLDGQDTRAVAQSLGISPAGVLTRLCRARQCLRELLSKEVHYE